MKTKRKGMVEAVPEKVRDITLSDEMDRLFNTFFHRGWLRPFDEIWPAMSHFGETFEDRSPRMDVVDEGDEILVRVELPGVKKDDLDVNLTGQTLTVKGERRHEEKTTEGEYFRAEIAQGAFKRTIRLPEEVDYEKVKAKFIDGELEVHLPKAHKEPRHTIDVE